MFVRQSKRKKEVVVIKSCVIYSTARINMYLIVNTNEASLLLHFDALRNCYSFAEGVLDDQLEI